MTGHFRRLYDEIMSLALFYIISAIPIRYNALHIDIIILETLHIKYNMFNLVYHPFYT